MQKTAKNIFLISTVLFLLLVYLLLKVDVQPIGPDGSPVGLATVNQFMWNLTGENIIWYHITDWLGLVGIFTAFGFAVLGLCQLIKRRSFLKVDKSIYVLGAFYIVVIALYLFFETNIINYRPVLMNGFLEASFPSSHTMIICSIMGTAIFQFSDRIKNTTILKVANYLSTSVIAITVIGRFISGVHWFTDILGGLLLSASLISLYFLCISLIKKK